MVEHSLDQKLKIVTEII